MKKAFLVLILIYIIGCGSSNDSGSNDSGSSITPPGQNLVGTYELADISGSWLYGNGVRYFDDTSIVHGTLELGNDTFYQVIAYDNDPFGVPQTTYMGTYYVNYTNGTEEGTIGIVTDNMAGNGTFTTSGNDLLIVIGAGQATWAKISDSIN